MFLFQSPNYYIERDIMIDLCTVSQTSHLAITWITHIGLEGIEWSQLTFEL